MLQGTEFSAPRMLNFPACTGWQPCLSATLCPSSESCVPWAPPETLPALENFFRILPSSLSTRFFSASLPLQALISEMKF